MRTIALINQKGGVGKTTTAVNLAACLADLGKKVVLIDLDPQGNSSSWMGININELHKSMFNVFHDNLPIKEILHETNIENMWIVPSNVTLAAIERTLANKLENDTILKKSISPLINQFDYIILDCPPSLGLLTVNALSAVKEVIIPLETKVLALNGLVTLINTVNLVKDTLNPALEVTGIIACMFDVRTNLSNKVVEKIMEKFHDKLFKSIIRESTQLAECPISNQPITRYAPDSRGTQDYMDLAREVIEGEKGVERLYDEGEAETGRNFDEKSKVAGQQSDNDEYEIDQQCNDSVEEGKSGTGCYADEGTEDVSQQNLNGEDEVGQHSGEVKREADSQFDDERNEVDRQNVNGEDKVDQRFDEIETEAGCQLDEEKKDVDQHFGDGEKE